MKKKFEIVFTYVKDGQERTTTKRVWVEKAEDIEPLLKERTTYRHPELLSAVEILPYTGTTLDLPLAMPGRREAGKQEASRPTYKAYTKLRLQASDKGIALTKAWKTFDGFFASTGQIPTTGRIVRKDPNKGFTASNCVIRIHVKKGTYPNRNNVRELIYQKPKEAPWYNLMSIAFK